MIRNEYLNGGFPINKRNPVMCFLPNGDIYVAYDRWGLKQVIDANPNLKCVGVWPGKHNTDCFRLDKEFYKVAPPVMNRDIDDATEISVSFSENQFEEITYKTTGLNNEDFTILSKDPELYLYISKIGLQHKSVYK